MFCHFIYLAEGVPNETKGTVNLKLEDELDELGKLDELKDELGKFDELKDELFS